MDGSRDTKSHAQKALAEIDAAAGHSVRQVAGPPWFARIVVLGFSLAQALFHMTPLWIPLGILGLVLGAGAWLYFVRRTAKPRTLLGQSSAYGWWFLLLLLVTQFANFWHADTWLQVGAKFVLLLVVLGFIMSKMLAAEQRWRLNDANEQAY